MQTARVYLRSDERRIARASTVTRKREEKDRGRRARANERERERERKKIGQIIKEGKIFVGQKTAKNAKISMTLNIISSTLSVQTIELVSVCGSATETLMRPLLITGIVTTRYKLHH